MKRFLAMVIMTCVTGPAFGRDYYYQRHGSNYRWTLMGGSSGGGSSTNQAVDAEMAFYYATSYGESRFTSAATRRVERATGERGRMQLFIMNALTRGSNLNLPNINLGLESDLSRVATGRTTPGVRRDLIATQSNMLSVRLLGHSLRSSAIYLKSGYLSLSGQDLAGVGEMRLLRSNGAEMTLYLAHIVGLSMTSVTARDQDRDIFLENRSLECFLHFGIVRLGVGYDRIEAQIQDKTIHRDAGTIAVGLIL